MYLLLTLGFANACGTAQHAGKVATAADLHSFLFSIQDLYQLLPLLQVVAAQHSGSAGCVGLDAHPAGSLIHHIYGLVWQEAVGDVTGGQADSCWQGICVVDALVMPLIPLLQAGTRVSM